VPIRTIPPGELERELASRLGSAEAGRRSARRGSRRPHGRARAKFAGLLGVIALMVLGVSGALAVHNLNLFELDENATNGAAPGDDWDQVYGDTSSAMASVFVADGDDFSGGITVPAGLPSDDTSYFTTGGSKDVNDVNQWMHQTGDWCRTSEILNAHAAAYVNA
jgi:hypothetical protein